MRRRIILGIIFVVAGLLKLADVWGIVHLDWLWQQPWTAYFGAGLIIYIGIDKGFEDFAKSWGCTRPLDDKRYS